ncbi:hypothetical protein [Pectobacterium phage CX5]|uniref:Uncharacterized protein n=1 Tax=Pectobacterium phage CX5 TaxID=2652426 RepID=A0A5P8D6F4_9CAUD|nr:hypothetical protein [Pectobacterium phage CX5]QFP93615.1 hypothetical protein [Pectobacterium phage CX5-1]
MPPRRKKADESEAQTVETASATPESYGTDYLEELRAELAELRTLVQSQVSLRDTAVLHLVTTAELHRYSNDLPMQRHRIGRCIDIANLVVKMLGEANE